MARRAVVVAPMGLGVALVSVHARLLRHAIATVLLGVIVLTAAWLCLFAGPAMHTAKVADHASQAARTHEDQG
jgi:hypothetical protein